MVEDPQSGTAPETPLRTRPLFALGLIVVLILSIANAGFLYLLPGRADTDYAWSIALPVSAAFLGAGYVAGLVVTVLGLLVARSWRSIRLVYPGVISLAIVLCLATLIHRDVFDWDYLLTWAWTIVYVLIPPGFGMFWWLQERRESPDLQADEEIAVLRPFSLILGAAMTVLAVLMFIFPDTFVDRWAWPISPLLSRVFAAWYALFGVILLDIGLRAKQVRELVIPSAAVLASALLLLALPLRYPDVMETGRVGFWSLMLLHIVLAAGMAWMLIWSLRQLGRTAENA
ncbi:hypothetical protein BH23CHL2_BH23CHL2_34130 [soil metagenome]